MDKIFWRQGYLVSMNHKNYHFPSAECKVKNICSRVSPLKSGFKGTLSSSEKIHMDLFLMAIKHFAGLYHSTLCLGCAMMRTI